MTEKQSPQLEVIDGDGAKKTDEANGHIHLGFVETDRLPTDRRGDEFNPIAVFGARLYEDGEEEQDIKNRLARMLQAGQTTIIIRSKDGTREAGVSITIIIRFLETTNQLSRESAAELRLLAGEADQREEAQAAAAALELFRKFESEETNPGTQRSGQIDEADGVLPPNLEINTKIPMQKTRSSTTMTGMQTPSAAGPFARRPTAPPPALTNNEPRAVYGSPTTGATPPNTTTLATEIQESRPTVLSPDKAPAETPTAKSQKYNFLQTAIKEANPATGFRSHGYEADAGRDKKIKGEMSLLEDILLAVRNGEITDEEGAELAKKCLDKMLQQRDFGILNTLCDLAEKKLASTEFLIYLVARAASTDAMLLAFGEGEGVANQTGRLLQILGISRANLEKKVGEAIEKRKPNLEPENIEDIDIGIRRSRLRVVVPTLIVALVLGSVAKILEIGSGPEEDAAPRPVANTITTSIPRPTTRIPAPTVKKAAPAPAPAPTPATPAESPAPAPATTTEATPTTVTLPIQTTTKNGVTIITENSIPAWERAGWKVSRQVAGINPVVWEFTLKKEEEIMIIPGNIELQAGQNTVTLTPAKNKN